MTDENTQPSSEEPASTNQTETPQANSEELPTLLAGEATQFTTSASGQETVTTEIADQPTMLVPQVEQQELARQNAPESLEIGDQPTMLVPRELAEQAVPDAITMPGSAATPVQPANEVHPFIQATQGAIITPDQPAGEAYPSAQESAPASGQLYAGPDPAANPYALNYAQPGYPQGVYQQPSIPLPLQPGQPGLYAPPRKRRTGLWISLIVLALFLLGGGTALAVVVSQRPTNTPTQALQQFCDGYKTLDARKVYDTLSTTSRANTSLSQIQQAFDELKGLGGMVKITDCKVSNVHENGSTATGTITITDTASFGGISASASVQISTGLVLENHTWKVDTTKANSQFTFPTPTIQNIFPTPTVSGN